MTEPTGPFQNEPDTAPAKDDASIYPLAQGGAAGQSVSSQAQTRSQAPAGGDAALFPFGNRAAPPAATGVELRTILTQRVQDMNLGNAKQLASPRARGLTVKDLNDLAAEFSGVATSNQTVKSLSLEDLNSLEAVFTEVKIQTAKAARAAAASGAAAPDVNVSCCCCTPCCSCASAATAPFDA